MTAIRLNDAEQEALQELTWRGHLLAVLMYLHEFRRRMNFKTFTVGDQENNRVREDFLAACVERRPRPGSRYSFKTHDRDTVQKQIKHLVDVGLLVRLPKLKKCMPMRFFFPLAAGVDYAGVTESVKKPERQTSTAPEFSSVEWPGFDMYEGWVPSDECVSMLAERWKIDSGFVLFRSSIFRIYWLERGERRDNWDVVFMRWFNRGVLERRDEFDFELRRFNQMNNNTCLVG